MIRTAAAAIALLAVSAGADRAFTLRDRLHHTWRGEAVAFRVPRGDLPDPARLLGPDGAPLPVQVTPKPGGWAEVAFVVERLPADAEVTYALTEGPPVGAPLARREGQALVLDAGPVAVRVPSPGTRTYADPIPLEQAPAPLQAVRGAAGAWLGQGRLAGDGVRVRSVSTTLVADGPVWAEARTDVELTGGIWSLSVRVVRGQEVVLVAETFDTGPEARGDAWFRFALSGDQAPARAAALGRLFRPRRDLRDGPAGTDYALDYGAHRLELSVLGYVPWWPETARVLTLHGLSAGQALSFFPRRIGAWRNPMGTAFEVLADSSARLSLPLFVAQTWARDGIEPGNPYYTGQLEEGWPPSASRRFWALLLTDAALAVPAEGRSAVAEAVVRHSDLPLDKVKDWVLDGDDPGPDYPRLYASSADLPALRERALRAPGWASGEPSWTLPMRYLLRPDPEMGQELLRGPEGALASLRRYAARFLDEWGYVGFPAPNNAAPMVELARVDAALAVAEATPAERAELLSLAAFVAHTVDDQDWHPTQAGWHLGNPNMPPRQEHHLAVASVLLPHHPRAAAWRERGVAAQRRLLREMTRPSGAWRESPHYEWEAAMQPLFQAAVPVRRAGADDLFAEPVLKRTWTYLVDLLTPPDPRFTGDRGPVRVLPAFGNGSWEMVPLFGWLGALTRDSDPAFSRRMMWAWDQQGRPDYLDESRLVIDPDLPGEPPALASVHYDGFGSVLRSGFPSPDETWVAFRHGDCVEHYNYGDQGSFMLYAKGAPLVLHFGSQYTPHFLGAWYFNRACVNHRPLTAADPVAARLTGAPSDYALGTELFYTESWDEAGAPPDYPMRNRAFASLRAADYARGEQVQRWQGVNGATHRVSLPPNSPVPKVPIPQHTWVRQLLLLKDPDPAAPNYLLVRDDFLSDDPLPGEWNLWTLAQRVETDAVPARVLSPHGVELQVYMAQPAAPVWSTAQDTNRFVAGPSRRYLVAGQWLEVLTNLRATQQPGEGFLAVLYPRRLEEPEPAYQALADGRGVKVTTPRGVDYAFLSATPVAWEGDGLAFEGTAGALRRVRDGWRVVLSAPGRARVEGQWIEASAPLERFVGRR